MSKTIIQLNLLLLPLLLAGCALLAKPEPVADPEAVARQSNLDHFNKSNQYSTQAVYLLNSVSPGQQVDGTTTWLVLNFAHYALKEAKEIDVDLFNQDYPGLGDHYRDEYLAGLELFIAGIREGGGEKFVAGDRLHKQWAAWYEANAAQIRSLPLKSTRQVDVSTCSIL